MLKKSRTKAMAWLFGATALCLSGVVLGLSSVPALGLSVAETGVTAVADEETVQTIEFDADYAQNEYVDVQGRTFYDEDEEGLALFNGASGVILHFVGKTLSVNWKYGLSLGNLINRDEATEGSATVASSYFSVFVDGEKDSNEKVVSIAGDTYADQTLLSFEESDEHVVRILKRNDSNSGAGYISSVTTDGYFEKAEEDKRLKIEVFGDSLTAGLGALRDVTVDEDGKITDSGVNDNTTTNVFQSYAGYMAQELDARLNVFGRSGITMKYSCNSNVSILHDYDKVYVDATRYGDDCEYDYTSYTPDVVVISLGPNDYLQSRKVRKNTVSELNMLYSANGLKAGFEAFIRNVIGRYYGKDIPIFLCSGLMVSETTLDLWMEDIKDMLKDEFVNLETVTFDACMIGHPVYQENEVAGKTLAAAISEKLESLSKQ